jgi:phosphoglycolate phosphatase-like HAD superfamily hydrolase
MPLTLEQYATYLDTRELPWPSPPAVERPKAKPHLVPLPGVRAVLWNVYGTLLNLAGGELYFEHPQPFFMNVALDKTLQEFKMWGSMSRKPGQPADYLAHIYQQVLLEQKMVTTGGEKHPETLSEKVWESIIKKLFQKDYKFDAGFFGSLNEFSRKVAYFFHASLQGTACYPGAAETLQHVAAKGVTQGLLADAQYFTVVQLQRGLTVQDENAKLDELIEPKQRWLSYELRAKKPSERLFRAAVDGLREQGIEPNEILHIGSRLPRDVVPAKRLGMRTGLFAGDKASLQAKPEQLKDAQSRPDVLLTELSQIAEVVGKP